MPDAGERVRTSPITPDADRRTDWFSQHRHLQHRMRVVPAHPGEGCVPVGVEANIWRLVVFRDRARSERSKGWLHCWPRPPRARPHTPQALPQEELKIHRVRRRAASASGLVSWNSRCAFPVGQVAGRLPHRLPWLCPKPLTDDGASQGDVVATPAAASALLLSRESRSL